MSLVKKGRQFLNRDSLTFIVIRSAYTFYRITYQGTLSIVFRVFPIKNNKIVINNHHGQGYGDNAKYIVEELLNSNVDYDIVWLLKDKNKKEAGLPDKVRVVKFGSIKSIYEMTTARLWIENNRIHQYLFKRKGQFYLQTWHGGLGLKKIEGDAPHGMKKRNIKFSKRDSKMTDLYISNSQHLTDIYKRAFWYDGEVLEAGYPKNDILFKGKQILRDKVREYFNLLNEHKILLYAPTFRENGKLSAYDIDFNALQSALNKQGNKWKVIIRLHPNVDDSNFKAIFGEEVINGTHFPDMQELVLGIDTLVTDYSSCMFDSAIAQIPTFIYASDIASYIDERGFYFSLDELPFDVAVDTNNLIKNIIHFIPNEYSIRLEQFYKKVGLYDEGNASKIIAKRINTVLNYMFVN